MKNAFIIHGAYGSPEENWIPWLVRQLENKGYEVVIPAFPTPRNQNLKSWMKIIEPYLASMDEQTILIGHSIGATFLLSALEKIETCVAQTFLVAGFTGDLGEAYDSMPQLKVANNTIAEKEFDWLKIKNSSKEFYVIYGDNDPYVSIEKSQQLIQALTAEAVKIKNGGHINEDAGYIELPQVLEKIK